MRHGKCGWNEFRKNPEINAKNPTPFFTNISPREPKSELGTADVANSLDNKTLKDSRQNKLYPSVMVPPAPVRVPSQLHVS